MICWLVQPNVSACCGHSKLRLVSSLFLSRWKWWKDVWLKTNTLLLHKKLYEKAYKFSLKVSVSTTSVCVCVFLISPTPTRSSGKRFLIFLSIFFSLISLVFPHLSAHLKWFYHLCSLPLTSSFHFLIFFISITLFPSPWCLWPMLIYATWSYSNCRPSALWDRHVTCGAPRPNVITSSICLWHTQICTFACTYTFLCNSAAIALRPM